MGTFAVGDVLLVRFPFSGLQSSKVRPVLVAALSDFDNVIVCQITSKPPITGASVQIDGKTDNSGLNRISFVRPDKIFTADPGLITRKIGRIGGSTKRKVCKNIVDVFGPLKNE
ncbi:MAG: type II toxin-antitoxin system PemK/MazF family toxin [Candidatus Saccharibacteria bacterium]|nr:type II toxin-antitoxin system PemK/MazF family toxin [Candidatus Saccharibacteria bacterium]